MSHPISWYAHQLRPHLSPGAFATSPSRFLWLAFHMSVVASATVAIATHRVPLWCAPFLSVLIGLSMGCGTFVAHEALHGAVVRSVRIRHVVGFLGFLPFAVSPLLWVAWHNKVHHGNTNRTGVDPDSYPTLAEYEGSARVRAVVEMFAMGRSRLRGLLSVILGFTVQSTQILVRARTLGLSAAEHRRVIGETLAGVLFWATVGWLVGPLSFVFVFGLPLLVANAVVMVFILTNHSLSPQTAVNDPLENSLTVTAPRIVEWVTLNFGYHVEHHIFPAMSSANVLEVRDLLRERWPLQYQEMPITEALLALHRSARVYKDDHTLIDPPTGREWPALQARIPAPAPFTSDASSDLAAE
jgi:fatty acid desaturase